MDPTFRLARDANTLRIPTANATDSSPDAMNLMIWIQPSSPRLSKLSG
jgi:hypothetical protein